jgi:hypothetical protein
MKLKKAEAKISKLIALLNDIEKDCLQLKKQGELTEYGDGQFDLIQVIRQELSL